jgi:hypothetical protein
MSKVENYELSGRCYLWVEVFFLSRLELTARLAPAALSVWQDLQSFARRSLCQRKRLAGFSQ